MDVSHVHVRVGVPVAVPAVIENSSCQKRMLFPVAALFVPRLVTVDMVAPVHDVLALVRVVTRLPLAAVAIMSLSLVCPPGLAAPGAECAVLGVLSAPVVAENSTMQPGVTWYPRTVPPTTDGETGAMAGAVSPTCATRVKIAVLTVPESSASLPAAAVAVAWCVSPAGVANAPELRQLTQ